jgi:hypothetical protein
LRRLPVKLAMAAIAVGGGYWAAMVLAPAASKAVDSEPVLAVEVASIDSKEPPPTGNDDRLILEVLETLERRPNIAAKLRQSARLGDDRLSGEGAFWQQGVGNQRRTRWDLTTLVAGERAFVTQVFNGELLWTDRKLPSSRKVTRVDISTLRRQVGAGPEGAGQGGPLSGETMPELLARGGVSQLVASLHRSFTFGPRQTLRRGDRTMLALIGRWRPEQLERFWPGAGTMSPADWPAHLPHHVVLYIDANDRFPYFVEYRGGDQADLAGSADAYYPAREALASFEFIEVQFAAAMPADIFEFTPPDISWHDITSRLVDELRPPPAAAPEVNTARRSTAVR